MNHATLAKLITGFAMFTFLTGARGCYAGGGVATTTGHPTYTDYPPAGGGTVVHAPADSGGAVVYGPGPALTGDLALAVYAPPLSAVTPDTQTFNLTIREGGAFGPVVLEGSQFAFDGMGTAALDIAALPLGFYDVEAVGIDFWGNAVSHAAAGVNIDEALTYLTLDLEAVVVQGDVVLDLYEPDGGAFAGPIDTLDYVLWERDPATGEYILVEEMSELLYSPWDPPVIGGLELGDYYIEVYAYDAFGYWIYEFAGDFSHDADLTTLQIGLWYAE